MPKVNQTNKTIPPVGGPDAVQIIVSHPQIFKQRLIILNIHWAVKPFQTWVPLSPYIIFWNIYLKLNQSIQTKLERNTVAITVSESLSGIILKFIRLQKSCVKLNDYKQKLVVGLKTDNSFVIKDGLSLRFKKDKQ